MLSRVREGAFADRAFAGEAKRIGLDERARSAGMRLTYGTVQRRRSLDHLIDARLDNPERVEPDVRDILQLGTYELVWSDGTPAHAVVDQAVLAARTIPGPSARRSARAGVVNAVLRRLSERDGIADLDGTPDTVRHSFPDWIAQGLQESLGEDAGPTMAAANEPAESALRWNPLRGERASLEAQLPEGWSRGALAPESYVYPGAFDLEGSAIWESGAAMAQSRASQLVAHALAPQAGERVLDLCAAPGAKTTHLAALAGNEAEIVAVELHDSRAASLERLLERMGARARVVAGDAREVPLEGPFDAVLLDPPCTGTGVLSARPDARWRRRPESLAGLVELQSALLARALDLLRPGGRVVYSTCSLLAAENEEIISGAGRPIDDLTALAPEAAHPALAGAVRTLPSKHGTDGFFIARITV